ncbi:hypothetical protein EV401DRAFT_979874 [Pisolithus croceorrhizus]|nr:hypothetical protein EV401DRAFT_979874 [Pisolithus croceorrhizus]
MATRLLSATSSSYHSGAVCPLYGLFAAHQVDGCARGPPLVLHKMTVTPGSKAGISPVGLPGMFGQLTRKVQANHSSCNQKLKIDIAVRGKTPFQTSSGRFQLGPSPLELGGFVQQEVPMADFRRFGGPRMLREIHGGSCVILQHYGARMHTPSIGWLF